MRPLRFLLSLATCIVTFFLVLYIGPWRASAQNDVDQNNIRAYFNWRTPSSLFPPSALITLTDDNSTFFAARPANFGPLVPERSISGQLWVGSGFGDDRLGRSASGGGLEGELGCSDMPGWSDGNYASSGKSLNDVKSSWADGQKKDGLKTRKRDVSYDMEDDEDDTTEEPAQDDGTDDHLHHPLPPSDGVKTNGEKQRTHADIQSLQESAEIAGKIVLLSRGGCGFLEKVKWVQRRGGVALIVGDDVRGEPLLTMYARGDTSNITIPSLFTSHTTAHLLSSLIPSGSSTDGMSPEEAQRLGLAFGGKSDNAKAGNQKSAAVDKPNFTTTTAITKATPSTKAQSGYAVGWRASPSEDRENAEQNPVGWFGSLFGRSSGSAAGDSRRPPSSGNIGWVLQDEFEDVEEDLKQGKFGRQSTTSTTSTRPTVTPDRGSIDDFVIGVQDWRDRDLVGQQKEVAAASSSSTSSRSAQSSKLPFKGDSITPGSGEYVKAVHDAIDLPKSKTPGQQDSSHDKTRNDEANSKGWLGRFFGSGEPEQALDPTTKNSETTMIQTTSRPIHDHPHTVNGGEVHEGLWVTLSPTSISTSPFFDTLLVLVVSPLVTLTVVYALLLLRSRIRRRRWRAPKSVVERLPVRTYQTMPSTTVSSSTTSSISSPITATTPLLPSHARPINARSRPRSRTTPEVPVQPSSSYHSGDSMASPSLDQIEEKRAAGLSEWRRRYGGKQKECVVCLEEYVDGVSRVMSLPCGHEFHAECITPWLTTRRRTCPICKGDVVRSLARSAGSSTSPPQVHYPEEEDSDDVQEQAAVTRNDDPAAAQPVSREDEMFEDLERGVDPDRTR